MTDILIDRKTASRFLEYYNDDLIEDSLLKLITYVTLNDLDKIIDTKNHLCSREIEHVNKIIVQKIILKYILTSRSMNMPTIQSLTAHLFNDKYNKKIMVQKNYRIQ